VSLYFISTDAKHYKVLTSDAAKASYKRPLFSGSVSV